MADTYIFMQGPNGPLPIKVIDQGDGTWAFPSEVTATIGSMTANAGTNLNTSLLALEGGGNLADVRTFTSRIPALGQALAAASVPVVLPTAQVTTLTPPAAITGYALETGGNIAAIKSSTDKIPALGQALAAASVPVVLTAAQLSTLTPPAAITSIQDGGPSWTSLRQYTTSADMSAAVANLIAAPGAGVKAVITDLLIMADIDMTLTLTEDTTGTVQMALSLKAGVQFQFTPRGKWKLATNNKRLQGQTSASGNIHITVLSYTEA